MFEPLTLSAAIFLASSTLVQNSSGLLNAVKIAERTTNGQVIEVEAERGRSGRLHYELDVLVGGDIREMKVDTRTGRITTTSRHELVSWARNLFADNRAMRDFKPLSTIIVDLEQQSGGTVTEVEFEDDDHRLHYQIDISTSAGSASLYIDPISGQRLGFALDD